MQTFFKRATATALVVGLVAGGMNYASPTAEAISLGGIGKGILGNILGSGTDVNAAKEKMLKNYQYSLALLQAAYQNVQIATSDSINNRDLVTNEVAANNALSYSDAGTRLKNGAGQDRAEAERAKKYLQEAIASGDEDRLKRIDEFIKQANNQRLASDVMANVSYAQAGLILKAQAKSIASGNAIEGIGEIINTVNQVKEMLQIRSELSNLLKTATQEYRKTRGIKDPSKKEQQQAANAIVRE